jgi:DNA-binding transcriptional regulator YdaS (Cro superfamily)
MDAGMALIRSQRGMQAEIARGLGLTRAAITKWQRVPAERVVAVEKITGIPRQLLRPDLWSTPRHLR